MCKIKLNVRDLIEKNFAKVISFYTLFPFYYRSIFTSLHNSNLWV